MKIGVVTTTINIPTVLKLYAASAGPETAFFVAGDRRTPFEIFEFCKSHRFEYLLPAVQDKWRSSGIIGWNTDSRRNFAILEALRWGADVLITVDDDMIPMGEQDDCLVLWACLFDHLWSGLAFSAPYGWFDHGQFTVPPASARGLPQGYCKYKPHAGLITDVSIGAAQGIILGTPDTDASTAITHSPIITGVSDILRYGFVVNPHTKAVFNSQFTAFRRELAPAAAQFYGEQGRNTDIFASVLMRYECLLRGWWTYYGPPFGYHARQQRPPLKDLKSELWGIEHIDDFSKELEFFATDRVPLPDAIAKSMVLSDKTKEFYGLWFEDCAQAMK